MRRFLALLILLTPLPALAGPADDVRTVEKAWSDAFARNDWAAITALYTEDATLYGSKPSLSVNRDGIQAYFEALPKGVFKGAKFGDLIVRQVAPDVLTASGPVTFEAESEGKKSEYNFRITFVLLRKEGAWRIAAHHSSPIPR